MISAAPPVSPRVVERFFQFSLLGMLATGYFALLGSGYAGSGYLDWPVAVLALAGLLLRALMAADVIQFDPPGRAVAAIAIAFTGFYPIDYLYVSGSFLRATIHLVCFLAVLKVLTAKTDRDYLFVKLLAVLELMAAAVLSASLSFFGYLTLFVLLAIATFASGEVRRAARGRPVARIGLRAFPRRLGMLVAFLFVAVLAMTAGMFFVLPRTARAALERFIPQRDHLSGFSNTVRLGEIGEIKQSHAAVMHVRRFQPYEGEGFLRVRWRGMALSEFDGQRWFNPPGGERTVAVTERGLLSLEQPRAPVNPTHPLIYQVQLSGIVSDTLFIAGTPQRITIRLPFVTLTRGEAFRVPPRFGLSGLTYGVYSFAEEDQGGATPPVLPLQQREELLRLPTLDERIPRLARDMTLGAATDGERARRIEYRLRHDYGYTLELLPKRVPDPLAFFLFTRKKGHCEYFASAMAVMLRTLGIPSRVVTGFQSGVYNPLTGWQVVRASDAHSWVEAWIGGRGWTTFDPTPPDPGNAAAGISARLSLYMDAAEQFWQDWVLSYDLERQMVLASRMDESARRFRFRWIEQATARIKDAASSGAAYASWLALLLTFAILAAFMVPLARRWWTGRARTQRLVRGEGRASDATVLYQRMLALLERRGIQKPPWLTPAEFARVLPASDIAALVEDLTGAYNEFRFGNRRDAAPRMVLLLEQLENL